MIYKEKCFKVKGGVTSGDDFFTKIIIFPALNAFYVFLSNALKNIS